jgi:hypothetical protein
MDHYDLFNNKTFESLYSTSRNEKSIDSTTDSIPAPIPLNFSDKRFDNNQVRTGTSMPMLSQSPEFIEEVEENDSISIPSISTLEEAFRLESERIIMQETLMNRVVYDSIDASPFPQSENNGDLSSYYPNPSAEDLTLVFESRFESGNLRRVVQIKDFEYDLILKPDYNTRGNTQWYYFSMSNTRAGATYRINIVNMIKPDSLYNYGMKPCVYSKIEAEKFKKGWRRDGSDICYYQNTFKKKAGGNYFTLTFRLTSRYDNDTLYVAHCHPYTYSDLCKHLNKIMSDSKKRNKIRRKTLCLTIAGNPCDVLTITNFTTDENMKNRKGVVVFARVHPGESNSSWMMKGLIDYLTGPSLDAKIIRENFIFKIVPMLNPDGVINGNYRCGLAGVDLNRCWIDPSPKLHPTIYHAKQMLKQFKEETEIVLVCDMHGHSRKKNIFMYGCSNKNSLKEQVFPKIFETNSDLFSFTDCEFGMQKSKEATARIVIYKEFEIVNSYTIESSFCGADFGKYRDLQFNPNHLQEIGRDFCDTLLDFCDPNQTKVRNITEELEANRVFNRVDDEEEEVVIIEEVIEDENGK